jgi:pyruvate formate lyase activating enzyme
MPGRDNKSAGIVFDIVEFAVHDGPGIRTTVFLKGCSLACSWCHNPEGLSKEPQLIRTAVGERLAGTVYTAEALAEMLNRQADIFRANEGGVTFSGGEPLLQAEFILKVIALLDNIHVTLDTSGYAKSAIFREVAEKCNLILFDLKLIDEDLHVKYTNVGNRGILHNLAQLGTMHTPFIIRIPLIPGVTDTDTNLSAIVEKIRHLPGLQRVDLLPYNKTAAAKYPSVGLKFRPGFNEQREVNINVQIFEQAGLTVHVN